ncbi:MAG: hypothetical protein QXY47_06150 [Thermoplasmata archaeon]
MQGQIQHNGKTNTMVAAPQHNPAVRTYPLVPTPQHNPAVRNVILVAAPQHNPAVRNNTHPKGCGYQGKGKSKTMVAAPQHNPVVRNNTHPKGCGYQRFLCLPKPDLNTTASPCFQSSTKD